jgi:4-amino-4-deoxy-L-arabinose transferase-like glycosyltransferase
MRPVPQESDNLFTPLALVAILGLTFLLRMKFWNQPFQMDEGVYAYIGWGMLDGLVPYKDVFDHKPPGIYLLYSLVFLLTEPSTINVKVFASIYTLGTTLAVFLLARKVAGTKAGCLSALLFGIFSCGPKIEGGGVNTEIFMILPYTLAAYFLLRAAETDKRRSYFLAGLFTGLACTIKQVAVVNVLWIAAFLLFRIWRRRTGKRVSDIAADAAAVAVGMVLPWIPFALYFYVQDGLHEFFYWQVNFNFAYMDRGVKYLANHAILLKQMKIILSENSILWLLVLVGLSSLWRQVSEPEGSDSDTMRQPSEKREVLLLMATWPLFSFLGIAMGGRYYGHYFIQLIPSLAVLGGVGLIAVVQALRFKGKEVFRQPSRILLAALIIWSCVLFVKTNAPYYLRYDAEQISFRVYGTPLFSVTRFVGKYLRERTQPDDLIYVWAVNPEINFYALRKSPSPFLVHSTAFTKLPWDTYEEVIQSLHRAPPRYIVAMQGMSKFPALKSYVSQNYQKEKDADLEKLKQIFAFEVYRRNEG